VLTLFLLPQRTTQTTTSPAPASHS
jgi:hypothetical protein